MEDYKLTETDLDTLLWENYYFLSTTKVQAMEAIWHDFAVGHLQSWGSETWGITSDDILKSLARLTLKLVGTNVNELAYSA